MKTGSASLVGVNSVENVVAFFMAYIMVEPFIRHGTQDTVDFLGL
jgi:hypothetical protein